MLCVRQCPARYLVEIRYWFQHVYKEFLWPASAKGGGGGDLVAAAAPAAPAAAAAAAAAAEPSPSMWTSIAFVLAFDDIKTNNFRSRFPLLSALG